MQKDTIRPITIQADKAHKNKAIFYLKNGAAVVNFKNYKATVPVENQFDLTQATIFGLNERLTLSATSPILNNKGLTLRRKFNKEWQIYNNALAQTGNGPANYGVYAYYPGKNHLVKYCSPFWHRVAAVASSSKLISDPGTNFLGRKSKKFFRALPLRLPVAALVTV